MRGKKTSDEMIYKIIAHYAASGSYVETGREFNMPYNTIKGIVLRNKEKKEFAKLLDNKREEFVSAATEIIDNGMELLNRRFKGALKNESEIEFLIEEILEKCELDEKEAKEIVAKLNKIRVSNVTEIVRTIGVLYEKRALAKDEATENVKIVVDVEE